MPLSVDELETLRHKLLAKGAELAEILAGLLAGETPAGASQLPAEPGETEEEKVRRYLGVVQARIDAIRAGDGSYGRCEVCGAEIPYLELEQLPWADRCRRCAAAS